MQSTIVINKCGKHFLNVGMKIDGIDVENFNDLLVIINCHHINIVQASPELMTND